MPNKKYKIIYADPPRSWENWNGGVSSRDPENHYNTLTLEQIKLIDIRSIADEDSILVIWATFPKLFELKEIIEAWGFVYKTVGWVWVKTNNDNSIFIGTGYYTRANAELLLIATRGKILPRLTQSMSQIVLEHRQKHSKKPNIFRHKIVELFGDLPRIELFARERFEGWDAWGDQLSDQVQTVLVEADKKGE